MMILMTAALAAAAPAVSATPATDGHVRHMAMSGPHEQKDCCPCCKDMADKHGGHDQRQGHDGQ